MRATVELCHTLTVATDLADPLELTLPIGFDGPQPGAFHLPDARETPVRAGSFVGAIAQGGSVNCMELSLFPHGNGTHTECAAHVVQDRTISMARLRLPPLLGAILLTVTPEPLGGSAEGYDGLSAPDDRVVTAAALRRALALLPAPDHHPALRRAVIVRTHPNPPSRRHTRYGAHNPPYLTGDAVDFLIEHGVEHLVLDLPSLDREHDGGTTPNHRRWFGVAPDAPVARPQATVTELVYVPDDLVDDGACLVALQWPAIETDAVPSRVTLFRILETQG